MTVLTCAPVHSVRIENEYTLPGNLLHTDKYRPMHTHTKTRIPPGLITNMQTKFHLFPLSIVLHLVFP